MYSASAWAGFVNTLSVDTTKLNAAAATDLLVTTAITARDRVLGGMPRPSGYKQIVDGATGAPLTAVRPDGTIILTWQYLGLVVAEVLQMLVETSPALTGDYIRSILLLVDGVQGAAGDIGANTRKVTLVPTVPYARRLEVGLKKNGRPFVVRARPHFVEMTAIAARRLFAPLANIEFNHIDLPGGGHQLAAGSKSRRRHRGGVISEVWYPAITLSPTTF